MLTLFCAEQEPVRSSDYMANLPDGEIKRKVILGCTSCHQLGAPVAIRKTKAEWEAVIKRMFVIDDKLKLHLIPLTPEQLVDYLTEHSRLPETGKKTNVAKSTYKEYPAGDGKGFYHDMALAGGRAWIADYFGNKLYGIDPVTGQVETFDIPVNVKPGKPGGAHAMDTTADGTLWITFTKSEQVLKFDPQKKKFRIYSGFRKGGNVQYFVMDSDRNVYQDKQGHIWVSHFSKEILSRLNTETGEIKVYNTTRTANMKEAAVHLYAAVADSQGRIWYTETHGNRFGYLDPATGKTSEEPMSTTWAGPKRLAIDKEDRLWIPELATGQITIYDTRARKVLRKLDMPIKGDYLYCIRRNPHTGDMWVTGSGSDSLYRIDPQTFKIRVYRLPRRGTFTRTVVFDKTGNIWTSYASFPNYHTQMPHKSGVVLRLSPSD